MRNNDEDINISSLRFEFSLQLERAKIEQLKEMHAIELQVAALQQRLHQNSRTSQVWKAAWFIGGVAILTAVITPPLTAWFMR